MENHKFACSLKRSIQLYRVEMAMEKHSHKAATVPFLHEYALKACKMNLRE
jgi:hypothetical protein